MRTALAIAALLCACGGAAVAPSPSATAVPSSSPAPSVAPVPAGAVRFTAQPKSLVTVRVQEHLAVNTFTTDAVLTTDSVSGALTLLADGTFAPDSKIAIDMTKLRSDQQLRDTWIRLFGIETNQFKESSFVPKRAVGLPAPLPESGSWTFTLEGDLTVHGVTKPETWNVTAKRTGRDLEATATLSVTWADFNVGKPQAAVTQVVSVSDEIRLEVLFVGSATG